MQVRCPCTATAAAAARTRGGGANVAGQPGKYPTSLSRERERDERVREGGREKREREGERESERARERGCRVEGYMAACPWCASSPHGAPIASSSPRIVLSPKCCSGL